MIAEQLLEELNKLSDDAIAAAQAKADELSFDKDKGDIPWFEMVTNLTFSRETLADLVKRNQFQQIPLTIQKRLLSTVSDLNTKLNELYANSNDTIKNILNTTEELYSFIWQNRLNNLSENFLGYETKNNELKNLITEAKKLKEALKNNISLRDQLAAIITEATQNGNLLQEHLKKADSDSKLITENVTKSSEMETEMASKLKTIKDTSEDASKELTKTVASNSQVLEIENRVRAFFGEIENYRKEITDTKNIADTTVTDNKQETSKLLEELVSLEAQVKDQLGKATGVSLFKAFDARRRVLVIAKNKWIKYIFGLIAAVLVYSTVIVWYHATTDGFSTIFAQKLLLNLPLILAIYFCLSQYNKERKLEEEYAFKSNISVSLVPYEELVRKFMKADDEKERQQYTKFLIDSITNVYTSPTEKIFNEHVPEKKGFGLRGAKSMTEVLNSVKDLIKTAKE